MQSKTEHEAPALEEAQEWIRKGSGLCARLQDERADLVQRIAAIDAALAALPGGTTTTTNGAAKGSPLADVARAVVSSAATRRFAKMSVPDLIRHVLRQHQTGVPAGVVLKDAQALRAGFTADDMHSALYRMKDVNKDGEKGSKLYSLKEETT